MKNLLHTKPQPKRYKGLKGSTWISIFLILAILLILETPIYLSAEYQKKIDQTDKSVRVLSATYETPVASESATPTEREEIENYIVEVFGRNDAEKAFAVIKCENSSLNPKAVNTAGNFPVGSKDVGVFQINEHWQRTQAKFLFNWKINVEIAHQLFEENGKSFKLWSCGRRLGI